ncbi:MAG: hypothetical protein GY754_02150 [bacterium]|nr:hypothetical protein [bacterium]
MEENQLNDLSQESSGEIQAQAKSAMIFGIVGMALSFLPIVGAIFGIIAISKQAGPREAIIASNFQIPGRAQVVAAKICGIIATITSFLIIFYYMALF